MTPQPAAAPQAPAAENSAPHAALLKSIRDTAEAERTSSEKQIVRALRLERDRGAIMKKIAANREYLRLMADNDELDEDETAWLDDFYPQKEKGQQRTDDEVERTRKAKAAARDGGAA